MMCRGPKVPQDSSKRHSRSLLLLVGWANLCNRWPDTCWAKAPIRSHPLKDRLPLCPCQVRAGSEPRGVLMYVASGTTYWLRRMAEIRPTGPNLTFPTVGITASLSDIAARAHLWRQKLDQAPVLSPTRKSRNLGNALSWSPLRGAFYAPAPQTSLAEYYVVQLVSTTRQTYVLLHDIVYICFCLQLIPPKSTFRVPVAVIISISHIGEASESSPPELLGLILSGSQDRREKQARNSSFPVIFLSFSQARILLVEILLCNNSCRHINYCYTTGTKHRKTAAVVTVAKRRPRENQEIDNSKRAKQYRQRLLGVWGLFSLRGVYLPGYMWLPVRTLDCGRWGRRLLRIPTSIWIVISDKT